MPPDKTGWLNPIPHTFHLLPQLAGLDMSDALRNIL